MPNIVPAAQQVSQMLSVYKQMREMSDPGPTGGEMWRAQQEQAQRANERANKIKKFNEDKTLMSMMLQNYQQANDDPFLQEHLQRAMMDLHGRVSATDPGMGRLLEAFTQNTPGSKQAYQQTMWLRANKAPPITANPEDDPHAWATQQFRMADWKARYGATFGGKEATPKTLLPTGLTTMSGDKGEALYAYRGKDGLAGLYTDPQLGLKVLADRWGVNLGEMITNGGIYGKETTVDINGRKEVKQNFLSIQDGIEKPNMVGPTKVVIIKDEASKWTPEKPQTIKQQKYFRERERFKNDLLAIQAHDPKNNIAVIVNQLAEASDPATPEYIIENILKPSYDIPGLQFYHKGDFDKIDLKIHPYIRAGIGVFTLGVPYLLGIKGLNPMDALGFHGYSDIGNIQFGFFEGLPATNISGNPVDYYWRKYRDGRVYLVNRIGAPVPSDKKEELMKKLKIRDPRKDYSK